MVNIKNRSFLDARSFIAVEMGEERVSSFLGKVPTVLTNYMVVSLKKVTMQ